MLKVARDQLEISKQALTVQGLDQNSFSAQNSSAQRSSDVSPARAEPPIRRPHKSTMFQEPDEIGTYDGKRIEKRGNHYYVDERPFITLGKAKKYINEKS